VKCLRDEGGPVKVKVIESLVEMRFRLAGLNPEDQRAPERILWLLEEE
jgi:hypothetical protein